MGLLDRNRLPVWQHELEVTAANWTTDRAIAYFYEVKSADETPVYRMAFNIGGSLSVGAVSLSLTVSGVTFKTGTDQAVTAYEDTSTIAVALNRATGGASTIVSRITSSTAVVWSYSGDVELDSKPSFLP